MAGEPSKDEVDRIASRLREGARHDPQLREGLEHLEGKRRPWWRRRKRRSRGPEPPLVGTGFPVQGFFVAREDEVDQRLVDEGPCGQVPAFEAKRISPADLGTLGEILGAGTYSELSDSMVASIRGGEGGECGLFLVAPEITDRLATLDDFGTVAAAWGAADETERWEDEDVSYLLDGVQPLARRACSEGRQLWVWWTL